jgi:hypothetical protein
VKRPKSCAGEARADSDSARTASKTSVAGFASMAREWSEARWCPEGGVGYMGLHRHTHGAKSNWRRRPWVSIMAEGWEKEIESRILEGRTRDIRNAREIPAGAERALSY